MSPLLALILLPIVGAILIVLGSHARKTAITVAALNLLVSIAILAGYKQHDGGFQFVWGTPVIPSMGISFTLGADGLSLAMLLLSTVVTLAAVCVARTPAANGSWFFASLLFISAGAIGAFASVDAFFFYMFHELALIPTFLLIGIWGSGDRQPIAWKVTIYLALGSFILLLGLIGLYFSMPPNHHSFDMREIAQMARSGVLNPSLLVFLLLFFGFGILVSLFPFHTWAPQAYASAPAPGAMLHAGVIKKFGLYGLLRLVTPVFGNSPYLHAISNLLLILLVGNILYIGLVTIAQRKLDLVLGYSSVMHMGYIFLGILSWTTLGLTGAAVMLVAHGLSIAALFALSGELRERTGTLDFSELGGLARVMPAFGIFFGFAAMASVGLPGFANFAGELMVFFGSFSAGKIATATATGFTNFQNVTFVAVWGVVISAVYMLRAYRRVFFGLPADRWKALPDLSPTIKLCVGGLLLLLLIIGFCPQLLVNYVLPALLQP